MTRRRPGRAPPPPASAASAPPSGPPPRGRRNPLAPGAPPPPEPEPPPPRPAPRLPTSDQVMLRLYRGDRDALVRDLEASLARRRGALRACDGRDTSEPANASVIPSGVVHTKEKNR